MSVPDVILIGGPPGAGKTTLGRALAARLGYASTTVDDLAVVARSFTSADTHPPLHVMHGGGHTAYFTDGPVEKLISDAEELSELLWGTIKRVVRSHQDLRGPVVLDWWLFSPDKVAALGPEVGSIWLSIEPVVLEQRERELAPPFVAGSEDPERMMRHFMARSLWRNDVIRTEAAVRGLPVLSQDGTKSVDDLVSESLEALAGLQD